VKHPRVLFVSGLLLAVTGVGAVVFVYTRQPVTAGQVQQVPAAQPDSQKAVATNTISIQNYTFSPQVITVQKGRTVIWTNNDTVNHTIVFDGTTISSSGSLGQGAGFSLAFDHAGTFRYHSAAYPDMTGTVIVTD
jgi:plastocyanin